MRYVYPMNNISIYVYICTCTLYISHFLPKHQPHIRSTVYKHMTYIYEYSFVNPSML